MSETGKRGRGRPKGTRLSPTSRALISDARNDRLQNAKRPIAPAHHGHDLSYELRKAVTLRDQEKCVTCGEKMLVGVKMIGTKTKQKFHDDGQAMVKLSRAQIRVRPLYGTRSDPDNPDHWVLICRGCWKGLVLTVGIREALKGIRDFPELE